MVPKITSAKGWSFVFARYDAGDVVAEHSACCILHFYGFHIFSLLTFTAGFYPSGALVFFKERGHADGDNAEHGQADHDGCGLEY